MELITEGKVIYLWSQQMIEEVESDVNVLKSRNIAVNVENIDRIGLSKNLIKQKILNSCVN